MAVLIALIALSLFSLFGLYMFFNATTELRISDNYESHTQAVYAARAGLQHARELLRGLNAADLLKGPDGSYTNSSSYLTQARTYGYRNLIDLATARALDVADPSSAVSSLPDDGLINTGKVGGTNGTALIPSTGIALTAANPYGSGNITTGRYFVKVSDNNGEASEIAADPSNDPFVDGDGSIIVRSVGVAQTIREASGGVVRANSVAIYEARYKVRSTFNLTSPFVVEGTSINATFNGTSFGINGGANVGLSTIDPNLGDATSPSAAVTASLAANQLDNVSGAGLNPSIMDITTSVSLDADKSLLMDPNYLNNLVTNVIPQYADAVYPGGQHWSGGSAPDIGTYDWTKAYNDPSQNPKVIVVDGDLDMSGNMSGGGLLVVRGHLNQNGQLTYNGLILVIGEGSLDAGGLNEGVHGGVFVAKLVSSGGTYTFGTPTVRISGNSNIVHDASSVSMAVRLIPASQISVREVTSALDP